MHGRTLVCVALTGLALSAGGCGSDDESADSSAAATSTTTTSAEATTDPALVGEWVATNDCEEFVAALEGAGLEQFAAKMAPGVAGGSKGKADPSDPCADTSPVEHSHSFTAEGDFNSYDDQGQEVDFGTYEIVEEGAFVLSRPPFESEVKYEVNGDSATFDPVIPNCEEKQCQMEAALAVATFFPRTYERVK